MIYSHPVSALPDRTCRVAIHVALNMGNTAGIDEDMIDAGGWENVPMDFRETAHKGQVDPVKDWVSVQTSIHLISISLSSLPLLFLIHASICCCQSLTYYYLLQKCDSVTSALFQETEV